VVQSLLIELLTKKRGRVSASVLSMLTFKRDHRSELSSEQWQDVEKS